MRAALLFLALLALPAAASGPKQTTQPQQAAAGVASFNTRTGAVVPVLNDYSFSLLSGSAGCGQLPALTGDMTSSAGTCATTAAGTLVKSITLNTPSVTYSSPVTFSVSGGVATGTFSLINQSANMLLAGPSSGAAASPSWRTLVGNDLPLSSALTWGPATETFSNAGSSPQIVIQSTTGTANKKQAVLQQTGAAFLISPRNDAGVVSTTDYLRLNYDTGALYSGLEYFDHLNQHFTIGGGDLNFNAGPGSEPALRITDTSPTIGAAFTEFALDNTSHPNGTTPLEWDYWICLPPGTTLGPLLTGGPTTGTCALTSGTNVGGSIFNAGTNAISIGSNAIEMARFDEPHGTVLIRNGATPTTVFSSVKTGSVIANILGDSANASDTTNLTAGSLALITANGTPIVTTTDTQTLTNKTLGSPTVTGTLSGVNSSLSSTSNSTAATSVSNDTVTLTANPSSSSATGFNALSSTFTNNATAALTNSGAALSFTAIQQSASTLNVLRGVSGQLQVNNSSAGTVTGGYGMQVAAPAYTQAPASQVFTTLYGLEIDAQRDATHAPTAYGVYQAGASDNNYFAGKVGINNGGFTAQFTAQGSVLLQGGAITENVNSNFTTSINTGSSTANVFLGGGSNDVSVGSHIQSTGTTPGTPTACGTGSPTVVGTDVAGTITTGTAATACTMAFASTFTTTPKSVVCSTNSTASACAVTSLSATSITFGLSAALSGTIYYWVIK